MLGDAAGLALAHAGVSDRVQQSGLTVVDVTHDGHHRRPGLQVFLAALVFAVGQVEGLQQLTVLVLRADDLDDVVHLAAQQLERLVADRLRGRDHLAEVEQRLHQRGRVGVDLLGEVRQGRAARQPDGLAVAVRQPHATDDRRLHVFVFGAFCPLRLAATSRRAAGTTERTGSTAALAGASAATAAGATAVSAASGWGADSAAAAVVTAAAIGAAATGPTGPATAGPRAARASRAGRPTDATGPGRHAAGRSAGARRTGTRSPGAGRRRTRDGPVDGLRRRERVIADARGADAGLRHRTGTRAGRHARVRWLSGRGRYRLPGGRRRGPSGYRPGPGGRLCRRGLRGDWRRCAGGLGGRTRRFAIADRLVQGLVERLVGTFGGRLAGGLRSGLFGCRLAAPERLAQPASDRRLYRRRCGFDEFALFIQPGEDFLAGDTEFLC